MPKQKPAPKPKKQPIKTPKFEADLRAELAELKKQIVEAAPEQPEKKQPVKGTYDPALIELYHQKNEGSYYLKETDPKTKKVEYVKYKPGQLVRRFKWMGMTEAIYKRGLREVDWPFHVADFENRIDYCGALAGHRAGKFVDEGGRVFLVTQEAKGVWDPLPKEDREPNFLMGFTIELFQQPGEWEHVNHWLAKGLSSMIRGDFRPGPALGLAGEPECGKSLFGWIVTQLFGGRSGKPWKYLMGEEKHNLDLVTSEVQIVSDPPATTDIRARRAFGNMIKEMLFEEEMRIRAMGKDALNAPLWHRLLIFVNDETENLMVFPPVDTSLRDKLSLIKCSKVIEAFKRFDIPEKQLSIELSEAGLAADAGDQDRSAIKRVIREEIHAYRAWLLRHWLNVPNAFDRSKMGMDPQMRTRRTGLCAYQNPELLEALTSHSPEVRLLSLIDQVYFADMDKVLERTITKRAIDIEKDLRASEFAIHAERLLSRFENACGTYLGRAAKIYPDRISRDVRGGGVPVWTIKNPPQNESDNGQQQEETSGKN